MSIDLSKSKAWGLFRTYWPVVAAAALIVALDVILIVAFSQASADCEALGGVLVRGTCFSPDVVLN